MMVLLVWLHVLAAVSWIGGTIFLSVVLVPVLRREPFASQRALLFRTIARRFRAVVWGAIAVLLFTGLPLLHQRGIPIADPSGWPMILVAKLGLVTILLLLTLTHDLIPGPRVGRILRLTTESRTRFDQALVRLSVGRSLLARSRAGHPVCRGFACPDLTGCEKVAILTRQTPAATSPACPEAAKTASLPRDEPFPMRRSRHP